MRLPIAIDFSKIETYSAELWDPLRRDDENGVTLLCRSANACDKGGGASHIGPESAFESTKLEHTRSSASSVR